MKSGKEEVPRKRYWLRGGIVGGMILFLIMHLSRLLIFLSSYTKGFFLSIYTIFAIGPLRFFSELFYGEGSLRLLTVTSGVSKISYPTFLGTLILLLIYFIIGAIICLIYGKVKKRGRDGK